MELGTCAKQMITIQNNTNLLFPLLQVVITMVRGLSLFLKRLTPWHSYIISIECQHMFSSDWISFTFLFFSHTVFSGQRMWYACLLNVCHVPFSQRITQNPSVNTPIAIWKSIASNDSNQIPSRVTLIKFNYDSIKLNEKRADNRLFVCVGSYFIWSVLITLFSAWLCYAWENRTNI